MPRSNLYQALRPQLNVGWRVAAYLGHDGEHGRNVVSVEGRGDDPPATPPLLPLVEKHGRGKAQLLCGPLELRLFSRVFVVLFFRAGRRTRSTHGGGATVHGERTKNQDTRGRTETKISTGFFHTSKKDHVPNIKELSSRAG